MDRHPVDADPDTQIRLSILMPIQIRIWILHLVLPMLENQKLFYFYSQQCQFTLVYLSHQRQRGHHFQYFEQYLEIFWKQFNLALHLVEMDTYPDPPIRSDPTGSGSERQ
jgi:hypothetical protein